MATRSAFFLGLLVAASLLAAAQTAKPGLLTNDELKHTVPGSYFFAGQSAPTQLRNSAGLRVANGKLVLAGLVDTSGYGSDIVEKYQGFFITETKLEIEGSTLAPGQYGFGFSKDRKFIVMDAGGSDVLSVAAKMDDQVAHPVPLRIAADVSSYRLYAGKKWVSLKP